MNAKTDSEIIWRKWVGEQNDPGSDPEMWLLTLQSCQLEGGFKNPTPAAEHKVWKLENHCPNLCFQLHFAILKEDIISHLVFMISFNTRTQISYDRLWLPTALSTKPWPSLLSWTNHRGSTERKPVQALEPSFSTFSLYRPRTACEMNTGAVHTITGGNWADVL